jgi:hypothetical protein
LTPDSLSRTATAFVEVLKINSITEHRGIDAELGLLIETHKHAGAFQD